MIVKRILRPDRRRHIPAQFSWIDHRLVRQGHLVSLPHGAAALYLFLLTVGDKDGLSYYCDQTLCRYLALEPAQLDSLRQRLCSAELIAYSRPLYQVLSLPPCSAPESREVCNDTL